MVSNFRLQKNYLEKKLVRNGTSNWTLIILEWVSLPNTYAGFVVSVIATAITLWNTKLKLSEDACHHKLSLPFLTIHHNLFIRTHNKEVLKKHEIYRQLHFIWKYLRKKGKTEPVKKTESNFVMKYDFKKVTTIIEEK